MNLKQVSQKEKDFLIPTYQRLPVMMVRGEGCFLFDDEGKEYDDRGGGCRDDRGTDFSGSADCRFLRVAVFLVLAID